MSIVYRVQSTKKAYVFDIEVNLLARGLSDCLEGGLMLISAFVPQT
jgi:hypothetical protein